jgi:ubiquinone/menaquinone biosynthesis C-methylase UbiE
VNVAHNLICSSGWWARSVERELLPWGLRDVELGDDVLEIGPGFGATSRVLVSRAERLTILELEPRYCERLRRDLGSRATVVQGDATQMPFEDASFGSAVCFTMLHHVPSRQLQDRLLAETCRVLRPGGTFAGTDSLGKGALFKLIHVGDTLVPVDPDVLPERLQAAGFSDVRVSTSDRSLRFSARKRPAAS